MTFEESNLPLYQSHKQAKAAKIVGFERHESSTELTYLVFEDGTKAAEPTDWFTRRHPSVGGYYLVYENGYTSYSPAEVFEEGYSLVP